MKKVFCLCLVALLLAGCGGGKTTEESVLGEPSTEEATIAVESKYLPLSLPAELEKDIQISYDSLSDGEKILFTAEISGETRELFHFVICSAEGAGYQLGTLETENAGKLNVFVNVSDYTNDSLPPEEYNRLNALQERVNDIMTQIQEDPAFTPAR